MPIYLDFASTSPVNPEALDAMMPYFSLQWGNASSIHHSFGELAKKSVEESRKKVASIINAEAEGIIFTSGSTEAINIGLIGAYLANKDKGNHIITVATEHKAVLETCRYLESIGAELTILGVNEVGFIDVNELEHMIKPETVFVSVMHVNNETGVIQDINKIGAICREKGILFFCDASQSVGKLKVDVAETNIDLLCLSAHKFNGPKGVGALFIRKGVIVEPILFGGGQEKGIRPGTYNTLLIVGLGKACEIAEKSSSEDIDRITSIRNEIEQYFLSNNIGCPLITHNQRSPYISSIQLNNADAETFIMMNRSKICISTGSACNSEVVEPSHVIMAMTHDKRIADRVIRLSFNKSMPDINFSTLDLIS